MSRNRLAIFILICALSSAISTWIATAWPAAVGTLDMPAHTVAANAKFTLTGWVKDPFGVANVRALVAEDSSFGVITSAAPDVDAMFPISKSFPGKRFHVEVKAPQEVGPFKIELQIRNTLGRTSVFDSLWLNAVAEH